MIRIPGSPSFSENARRILAGLCLVVLSGIGGHPATAQGISDQLDAILREAEGSIVRIDVRRPWNADWIPARPWKIDSLAVLRIQGTGVVWDDQGTILTVADLAQPGDTLRVRTHAGQVFAARYLGQDPQIGLSVIRVDSEAMLRPMARGTPDPLASRDWTVLVGFQEDRESLHLAIGRSLGLIHTEPFWRARLGAGTDPRMAGAAVLDGSGRWIGLLLGEGEESLLLVSHDREEPVEYCLRTARAAGTGWVVPVQEIAGRIDSIGAGMTGREGFLGVRARLPGPDAGARSGVVIAEVIPGSPAGVAGIRPEDRLVAFDGTDLADWDVLTERVATTAPGRAVRIALVRDGQTRAVEVKLGDRGHAIWRENQKRLVGGREKHLRQRIEDLQRELELLRHLAAYYR